MDEGGFDHVHQPGDGTQIHSALIEGKARKFFADQDAKIEAAYAKRLATYRDDPRAKVIKLSDIPADDRQERIEQLQRKMREYEQRITSQLAANGFDINLANATSNVYKRSGLKLLLTTSELNTFAFGWAIEDWLGTKPNSMLFNNACGVIETYVKHGGRGIKGGTGLK